MALTQVQGGMVANNAITATNISFSANTISGNVIFTNSLSGNTLIANTVSNTSFQTGSVENYMSAQGFGLGMRNRIINGAMMIDQRNSGSSVTVSNGLYLTDRWKGYTTTGVYTGQQVSDAPSGFTKSLKLTVTTSQSSLGSSDYYAILQNIEGNNITDLNWGSSNASPVTLSFWVKSSLTGTFSWTIQNNSSTSTYVGTFTISAANTWQKITAIISGPTTGSWATDNSVGILFAIGLGNGSTYSTSTINQWTTGNVFGYTGQTNFISTLGATFQITGVQLEKGSVATPFEYRHYGTELALCQRYYASIYVAFDNAGNSYAAQGVTYPVPMRASPTYSAITYTLVSGNISSVGFDVGNLPAGRPLTGTTVQWGLSSTARAYAFGDFSVSAEL